VGGERHKVPPPPAAAATTVEVNVQRGFTLVVNCGFASWMTHQAARRAAKELSLSMGCEVVIRRSRAPEEDEPPPPPEAHVPCGTSKPHRHPPPLDAEEW